MLFKWLYKIKMVDLKHFIISQVPSWRQNILWSVLLFIHGAGALGVGVCSCLFMGRRPLGSGSGIVSRSRRFERNTNVSSPSTCKTQYCGEPPRPRGSVLGLRPPRLEFRILCLVDGVISPSSGGYPDPI